MTQVFISYRRDDSADAAGRIYDRLVLKYGAANVFKDVDDIPPGADFRKVLGEAVGRCHVLLAVIGRHWLNIVGKSGARRLDDPRDFVRLEIEAALRRDIPVIPVLLSGAEMPGEEQLPQPLQELAYRHAVPVRGDPDFHRDVDRLVRGLDRWLQDRPEPAPADPPQERAKASAREEPQKAQPRELRPGQLLTLRVSIPDPERRPGEVLTLPIRVPGR